jgi:polygalacturonase
MAVTQISRIQNRRGLNQDLPQLAGAELGWSVDTRKLYIGNGTIEEGAPVAGITEVLTQYTDLAALIGSYTFKGNVTEYTVETGSSILNPTVRSFQQKFDDFVNVRDFGALGNGVADDTASIRRAIEQIYKESENLLDPRTRRTIYIPAGTYITSNVISIPPNTRLQGDGPNSTTISLQYGNLSVANICDSAFQSGSTIGSAGATLPDSIEISGIGFTNTAQEIQYPLLNIDSASNVRINNTRFQSNIKAGSTYPNVVEILSTSTSTRNVVLDGVQILGGGNGLVNMGAGTKAFSVTNSQFDDLSNVGVVLGSIDSYSSINNYFGVVATTAVTSGAINFVTFGETYLSGASTLTGAYLGNLNLGVARSSSISTAQPVIATFVADTSGEIKYEVSNSSARRFGTFQFSTDGTLSEFHDQHVESGVGVKANVHANATSLMCSLESGTGTFKYSINQFIS